MLIALLVIATSDLRARENDLPPEITSFMAEIQAVIKQYNLDRDFFYNGLSGGGIGCSYQFYIPTNEEPQKNINPSNKLVLNVTFPAPPKTVVPPPTSRETRFYSHVTHFSGDRSVYWSLTYGKDVPKDILESFKTRLQ